MPRNERPIGHPAEHAVVDPHGLISRFKIGDDIFEGSGVEVRRYVGFGGREIVQLELFDAILIRSGADQ